MILFKKDSNNNENNICGKKDEKIPSAQKDERLRNKVLIGNSGL